VIHPTGKFLYVLASGFAAGTEPTNPQELLVFSIDATTGALGLVSDMQVGIGNIVGHLAIEPTGRFAFFTSIPGLFAFSIDQSSEVPTPVASPPNVGEEPFGLSADPSGKFLYLANPSSNDLYTLRIDSGTGVLSEVAQTTVGNQPKGVAVDPKGKFVYITNNFSNSVSAFLMNSATGALTPAAGSPYAAGSLPDSLAIDPSGKFLLVNNRGSTDVSVYTIDATTGALRPVPGSPFVQETQPQAITVVQAR